MSSATPALASSAYRVYTKYTLDSLPSHPGKGWTRFVCLSDTHRKTIPMVDGDILIHAGDFSSFTTGFRDSLRWIKELNHPCKLLIAGNHEYNLDSRCFDYLNARNPEVRAELAEDRRLLRDDFAKEANLNYLEAESTTVSTSGKPWAVYGSPYTPEYGTMGFYYRPHEADDTWAPVPRHTEILCVI
ncbi:metallophosphoesterase domain-containing protein 1 [Ceratobasidium sp. AG-Ba]|nr:metallophosphoesterase domain-containing protein 1 [Ceratobasidium sp. AG-Ba]QRW14632.1 metallophosphoesterase domain-containing protein 1 [Ceratobasidium sp. AG-Ba]